MAANRDKQAVVERRPWWSWPEEMMPGPFRQRMRALGLRPLREWFEEAEEWLPDIDMFRKDDTLVVRADLPGIKPEDIEVTVEGDMLTIKGRREEEKEVREEDYFCSERATGEFERRIRLPEGVTSDQIEAHHEDGVLEVKIPAPKAAGRSSVKIPVN